MSPAQVEDRRAVLLTPTAEQAWAEDSPGSAVLRAVPEDWAGPRAWLAATLQTPAARRRCAAWAAVRLHGRASAFLEVSAPVRPVLAARLLATGAGEFRAAERLCAEVLGWVVPGNDDFLRWAGWAKIAPEGELPRWVLEGRANLPAALAQGDALARAGLPLGLRVEPAQWEQFLAGECWERAATRWRQAPVLGAVSHLLRELPSAETTAFLRRTVPAAAPLLTRAAALISAEKADAAEAVSPAARSAAEALLYAVLQGQPFTRDRFRLNRPLDFPFGLNLAEGDLVATDARLVVELDGYYHFRDAEGYRRDRRKDAALQEHGWFVLRFLAEDTVGELESIVTRIEACLARRALTHADHT